MSDSIWLRLFGGHRGRAAQSTKQASPGPSPLISFPDDDDEFRDSDKDQRLHRSSSPQHGWSWQRRGDGSSSTAVKWPTHSRQILFNEADQIHHMPSVDEMTESLRIVMITSASLDTIPREYNSNVLHLIEEYGHLKKKLSDAEAQLSGQEEQRQRDQEESAAMIAAWEIREAQYKSEIKRLEKVIHTGSAGGLEAVMVARSGSLVSRYGCSSPDGVGLPCLAENHEGDHTQSVASEDKLFGSPQPSILNRRRVMDPKNDVRLSRRIQRDDKKTLGIKDTADVANIHATGPKKDEQILEMGQAGHARTDALHQRNFSFVPGDD